MRHGCESDILLVGREWRYISMNGKKQEITQETFDRLVELAALALNEVEAKYLLAELNNQLSAVRELALIELPEDIQPASHGVPYTEENSPPLRNDFINGCEDVDAIIEQAPNTKDRYIVVPDIPHTALE